MFLEHSSSNHVQHLHVFAQLIYQSYLQLYVPTEEVEELVSRLGKERFIKKVRRCHIQELETPFVGSLYRNNENVIM